MKDLFDFVDPRTTVRPSDPETSHAAAHSCLNMRTIDRMAVLRAHSDHPKGLTDFELAALMRRQQTSVGKRRGELRDRGLIEATEVRRPSPSGSSAIVWKITSEGQTLLDEYEVMS